jgi:DNA repair exonuclease SbcCD ATPase subunit
VTQAPAEQKAQVEREWPTQTQDWTKQVEREWTRRLEADIEALGPAWEEALKRFQAEMERLQQSGEWQLMLDRLQEALSRMQAQSTERDQAAAAEQSMKQELERARAELDRTRALFERGLVSQTQMAEAEARLAAVSQRLAQDAQKHQLAQHLERQHEVEKTLKELAQHQKERSAEVEKMKREIEEHLKASRNSHAAEVENLRRAIDEHVKAGLKDRAAEMDQVKRAMDEHLKATLHDRAAEMEKVQQAMAEHLKATREARETEAAMLKHGRNLAPVEGPAAAGDVLEVRIGGEPDLPTHYDVRTDGTIRLPFLGSFKVVGQTAAQVQAAIGKQMADRKLGPANQVAVSVLRRR